jgi:ketosteroid isomerase-like protein
MEMTEKAIRKTLDGYKASVFAKDVDAIVALYGPDARIFDMWGEWAYEGAESWRRMVAEWFGSLGTERVRVEFDDVRTVAAGDVAMVHAFVTYKGLSAEGAELRAMTNRLTWKLRQRDGALKIIHEHTSAPADFKTGKIIPQRRHSQAGLSGS